MDEKFTAVVEAFKKCPKCDEAKAGIYERRDCGCVWDVEMNEYSTRAAARLAAMAYASRRGTTMDGRMNGNWSVESTEGIIEAGTITRNIKVTA